METNKEGDVTLSVVMPAYNEGAHITDNLLETNRVLSGFVKRYEIIAVDDGSADNTAECIRRAEMQDTHIRGISYQPNGGKGHAIRTGIAAAEGRYIAFFGFRSGTATDPAETILKGYEGAGCRYRDRFQAASGVEAPLSDAA